MFAFALFRQPLPHKDTDADNSIAACIRDLTSWVKMNFLDHWTIYLESVKTDVAMMRPKLGMDKKGCQEKNCGVGNISIQSNHDVMLGVGYWVCQAMHPF